MVIHTLKARRALITRTTGALKAAIRDADRGRRTLKVIDAFIIKYALTVFAVEPVGAVLIVLTLKIRDTGVRGADIALSTLKVINAFRIKATYAELT